MLVGDFQGLKVYRSLPEGKRLNKDGSPRRPHKLGRIHYPVFTPDGHRVVGFMLQLPDVAGMVKRADRFVALDAVHLENDLLTVPDDKASFDAAAAKRLGIDLDACLIWTGMDVRTESGKRMGFCANAVFNMKTGAVEHFNLTAGAASSALVGTVEMPPRDLVGYRDGAMIVRDRVAELGYSGGVAARAAEASVKVNAGVKRGAKVLDEKGSVAVSKGSRALGRQLGKTKGMFKAFTSEYKKAVGTSSKPSKKR